MQSPIHLLFSSNEHYNGSHSGDTQEDDQNGVNHIGLSHDTSLKVLKELLISLHIQHENRLTAYCAYYSTPLTLACQPNLTKGEKILASKRSMSFVDMQVHNNQAFVKNHTQNPTITCASGNYCF